jgi:hypothetical protein
LKSHVGSCKVSVTKHNSTRRKPTWPQLILYAKNCSMSSILL